MDTAESPEKPKKTALQKLDEDIQRQLAPLRQMQHLVKRHAPEAQMTELLRQFEPNRQIQEMLMRTAIPKHVQDILDGTSIAAKAQRLVKQYLPKSSFANLGLDNDALRRTASLTLDNDTLHKAVGLGSIIDITRQYEQYLKPISHQQEWLENLQRQVFGGLSAQNFVRKLGEGNPAVRVIEDTQEALDRLSRQFRDIDFSQFEADETDEREATHTITEAAINQATVQEAVDRIVAAIQAQQKPTVQLMLWLFLRKMMDWLIAGVIGAALGHYTPAVLGEPPQAAKKAVQETARKTVGSPKLLADYRYVSTKLLIVRLNPRARSPEIARLVFGKPVKLLEREKDFALVTWTDNASGIEMQGWVFARYLSKFN